MSGTGLPMVDEGEKRGKGGERGEARRSATVSVAKKLEVPCERFPFRGGPNREAGSLGRAPCGFLSETASVAVSKGGISVWRQRRAARHSRNREKLADGGVLEGRISKNGKEGDPFEIDFPHLFLADFSRHAAFAEPISLG